MTTEKETSEPGVIEDLSLGIRGDAEPMPEGDCDVEHVHVESPDEMEYEDE